MSAVKRLGLLWVLWVGIGLVRSEERQAGGDDARVTTAARRDGVASPAFVGSQTPPPPGGRAGRGSNARTAIVPGTGPVAPPEQATRSPSNDDCTNAYLVELFPGNPVTYQDDNTGATQDCPALSSGAYRDAWFKITTDQTLDLVIKYCGTSPVFYNAYIVMDQSCPCSGTWVYTTENASCDDGNWSLKWSDLPTGTYYWPLLTDSAQGYAEGPYTVTFDNFTPPPGQECPVNTMYGQPRTYEGMIWDAPISAVTTYFTYKCYENFFGLPDKIGDLHWWGLSLYFNPSYGWQLCDPTGMTFNVGFYVDSNGQPGTQACAYDGVAPTIADVGPYNWAELYYFSLDALQPCCVLPSGWLSIQSQLNAPDCAFRWLDSPTGDYSSYQDHDGDLVQLGANLAFCLTTGDCPQIFGACCDDYTGVCNDNVEWGDCALPLRFTPNTLCADISPSCGVSGACCDSGLVCQFTGFESECAAINGRFYPGESCPEHVCHHDCEHRIDLWDCYGDGWNGNTLDVLVNGVTVLSQITLPSGTGPLSYYLTVVTGDVIQTIYYPIGGWPYEPYYYVYDNIGYWLGKDGINGSNCYVQPTGITVTASCHWCPGACCYYDGGCEQTYPDGCFDGEFLGQHTQCSQCPCYAPCPPEGILEPEPCGGDTDNGCNLTTPAFAPIACGETVCGTTWADPSLRDTDWYQLINPDWSYFTWTVEQQIPLLIFVIKPGPHYCNDMEILYSATAGECQWATISTACLQPGEYWFWVGPSTWNNWPCEKDYTASLSCVTCPPSYCLASGGCDEHITRVQIDAIDNATPCTMYGDYTALGPANLPYDAPVQITVTNGNPIWTADTCSVWIDWNQDLVFDDTGSESLGDIGGVGPYVFNITAPLAALPGTTRMRIRIDYANSNPQPCGTTSYGEVEDYTVNVLEVPGACCWGDGTCTNAVPSECGGYPGGLYTQCAGQDCNGNGADDYCDIDSGFSTDCNGNGTPDECEPWQDCNGNGIRDICDIANCDGNAWCGDCNDNGIPDYCEVPPPLGNCAGENCSLDCQPDGIPDDCQLGGSLSLQIDDGSSENSWGFASGGELCWMNHMSGAGRVAAIGVTFGTPAYPDSSGVAPGMPLRVYVWSDPNQDGNPTDAVFLGETTGTAEADSIDTDIVQTVELATPIPVSGSFFIGASIDVPLGYPAPADDDGQSQLDQGFLTFNSVPFDPTNITANLYPMSALGYPFTVFILRVVGTGGGDCNGNGIPDECDIGGDPPASQDCEPNGIPDECEPDCDHDGYPDGCVIQYCEGAPACSDCNGNTVPDGCDIADGTSGDCNLNGIPDECDIAAGSSEDCNANDIPDECDVASGTSCDCQSDGIPDECQLYADRDREVLLWDDGSSEESLGLTAGGELCWMVHFTMPVQEMCVGQVQVCFGTPSYPGSSGVAAGQPVRVYLWKDPNGDGNPSDAVFLAEGSGTVDGASIDSDSFQSIPLSQWVRVQSSFFIGASVVTTSGYPAPMDENGVQYHQSWVTFNQVPFDPTNIGANLYNMDDIGYTCNWLLRAEIRACSLPPDCNHNQIQDECDIGVEWGGYCTGQGACFPTTCSSDWDHNGIPDECEVCGDLNNDGVVNMDDYWMFLDAFGSCAGDPKYNAAADLDGDGCVTLLDYQAWRMCYLMANGKEFVPPKPQPIAAPAKRAP